MNNEYDVIIIGAGIAGLTAAIYSARAERKVLVLDKGVYGGQAAITDSISNYPGCENITGFELAQKITAQAKSFGVDIFGRMVTAVNLNGKIKTVSTVKEEYQAKTVIIAAGSTPKQAGFKGEAEFFGKGISYCATCDGFFYKGKDVFVVGSGESAAQEAEYLSRIASNVTILARKGKLSCSKSAENKIKANEKIIVKYNTVIDSVSGDKRVDRIVLKNNINGEKTVIDKDVPGIFVFVGYKPQIELFSGIITLDEDGFIQTDDNMKTNIDGVYAVGDIRKKKLRQLVTAASDGAIAAVSADEYINDSM